MPKKIKLAILLIIMLMATELVRCYLYNELTFDGPFGGNYSLNLLLIGFLTNLFVAFNISHRQSWARFILIVFYLVETFIMIPSILYDFNENLNIGIVTIIKKLLQLFVLIILFSGDSNKWFNLNNDPNGTDIKQKKKINL